MQATTAPIRPQAIRRETPSYHAWLPPMDKICTIDASLHQHVPMKLHTELTRFYAMTIWDFIRAATPQHKERALHWILLWPTTTLLAIPPQARKNSLTIGNKTTNREIILARLAS